jgi:hypothetical protein
MSVAGTGRADVVTGRYVEATMSVTGGITVRDGGLSDIAGGVAVDAAGVSEAVTQTVVSVGPASRVVDAASSVVDPCVFPFWSTITSAMTETVDVTSVTTEST